MFAVLRAMAHDPHFFGNVSIYGKALLEPGISCVVLGRFAGHNEVSLDVVFLEVGIPLATSPVLHFVVVAQTIESLLRHVHTPINDPVSQSFICTFSSYPPLFRDGIVFILRSHAGHSRITSQMYIFNDPFSSTSEHFSLA